MAEAVRKHRGLIQNNHPTPGLEGRDQFDYAPSYSSVIVNTEICPDTVQYQGKSYHVGEEALLREFLNKGLKTGFVGSTDTHEGKTAAKTAVLATELTRPAIFEALQHRRNYAVNHARIVLDFKINGHWMGEEIEIKGEPRIAVAVQGTDKIEEVVIVRDGLAVYQRNPRVREIRFEYEDSAFAGNSYYYLRVVQADKDEHGNASHAWSSPIWVKKAP